MNQKIFHSDPAAGSAEHADAPPGFEGLPAANQAALEEAFARAADSKMEILRRPDMLNGETLGARLGLSRATVDNRRVAGKLLALDFGTKRGVRYPAWQVDLVGEGREAFEQTLRALGPVNAWGRYRFFVMNAPGLGGQTPIEVLRAGRAADVLHAAETWAAREQGGG